MEEKAHVNKMGVMPVKKLLIEMAWPAVLSMTINAFPYCQKIRGKETGRG